MEYGTGTEMDNDSSVDPQESSKIKIRPQVASRQKGKPGSTPPPGRRQFRLKLKKKSQRLSQRIAGIAEGIKEGGVSPRRDSSTEQEQREPASGRRSSANQIYSNKPFSIFPGVRNRSSNSQRRCSDQTKLASQITPSAPFHSGQSDASLPSIGYNPHSVFSQPAKKNIPLNLVDLDRKIEIFRQPSKIHISLKFKDLTRKIEIFRQTTVWDRKDKGSFANKEYRYPKLRFPFHSRETLFKLIISQKQQLIEVFKQELINQIKTLFNNYMDPIFREVCRQVTLDNRHQTQVRNFFIEMIEQLITIHPLTKEKKGLDTKTHCEKVVEAQLQSLRSLLNKEQSISIGEDNNHNNLVENFRNRLQEITPKIQPIIDNIEQIEMLLAAIEYHFDLYKNEIEAKIDQRDHLKNIETFHTIIQPILNKLCPNIEEKFSLQFDIQPTFIDLFSVYEVIKSNPNLIVCELHLLSKLPKNLSPYVNNYILLKNKEMYYIKEKKEYYYIDEDTTGENIEVVAKRIEINNFNKIPKNHKKISLSVKKLNELIILNGGHNAIDEIINHPSLINHFEHLIVNYFEHLEDQQLLPRDFKDRKYNNLYIHKDLIASLDVWLDDLFIIKQIFEFHNINRCVFNGNEMKSLVSILKKLENMQTIKDEIKELDNLLNNSAKTLEKYTENKEVKMLFDILSSRDEIKMFELLPLILKIYTERYAKQQEPLIVEQPNYLCP